VWTSDFVPSPLGAEGAGVQAARRGCSSSSSLSWSVGLSPLLSPLHWNGVTPI